MPYRVLAVVMLIASAAHAQDAVPARPGRFLQEVAVPHTGPQGCPIAEVRHLDALPDGGLRAAGPQGAARYAAGAWSREEAPGFDAHDAVSAAGALWIATDDGLYREAGGARERVALEGVRVNDLAVSGDGRIAAAAETGLYGQRADGGFDAIVADDGMGRRWGSAAVRAAVYDSAGRLWFGVPAGVAVRDGASWRFYTGADGLPFNDFTCAAAGPGGEVWFGTAIGAVRFDGREWAYRQGPRWLPGDQVYDIAVDAEGTAWFATGKGVGAIARRPLTLAEKAAHYEDEIERYIKRTEFGYTSEVGLKRPGDRSEIVRADSDNDGLWTAMYGASQCFAYAATKRPEAKARATQAFEALRQLQKVTQGGEHAPPKGFVARTILPIDAPDPNIGRIERDREEQASYDSIWKVYEPRWPKSADGKWYWKSDTSSDELDGHYFFYPLYYDLVAETDAERERVREVVRDLTDHLIAHDFNLVDHDGTPTRWSVFDPKQLNHDRHWWVERGLNSISILSYLQVAGHMTGDPRYGEAFRMLCETHGFHQNAFVPKIQFGFGSGNQSDDEMACMSLYNLVKYTEDTALRERFLVAFYNFYGIEQPEMNPLFNFAYAAFARGAVFHDQWGVRALDPWAGWLDDSMATLLGFPLDRVDWPHKNSHRIDLVRLPPLQSKRDSLDVPTGTRGYRVNGKVLPVENRHFGHWNTDPWALEYGGHGRELSSGTVFLLPYYMGLYHGFIEEDGGAPAGPQAAAEALYGAVTAFAATLSPEQRAQAFFAFDSELRTDWHYFPRERAGIGFDSMRPAQAEAAHGILRAALSAGGYETVETLRMLENVLRAIENGNAARDPQKYHFAIYGTPGLDTTWALRFEGHHLSLHWTIAEGRALASEPQFMGSNPARVAEGPLAGASPLGFYEELGRKLVRSFDDAQRAQAVLGDTAPPDILSGTKRDAIVTEHLGIAWAALSPEQQGMLLSLVEGLARVHRAEFAEARLARLEAAGLDRIKFAWLGGIEPGQGHYYRIQGSTFLLEYDNTQGNANHIHVVWRDFAGDFGADILKEHYAEHAHGGQPHAH